MFFKPVIKKKLIYFFDFIKKEFLDAKWKQSIDDVIDNAIQSCPIDTRRKLYENVVLSGGSSLIKGLDRRLKLELQV